ncbi:hypothetical protein DVH24_020916, partial [Malus domestica]
KVPFFPANEASATIFPLPLSSSISLSSLSLSNLIIVSISTTNDLFVQLGFLDLQRWEVELKRDGEERARNVLKVRKGNVNNKSVGSWWLTQVSTHVGKILPCSFLYCVCLCLYSL